MLILNELLLQMRKDSKEWQRIKDRPMKLKRSKENVRLARKLIKR